MQAVVERFGCASRPLPRTGSRSLRIGPGYNSTSLLEASDGRVLGAAEADEDLSVDSEMEADVRIDTPPDTGSETSATVEASTESTPDSEPIRLTAEHNPQRERTGVLLINLGTPDEPSVPAVRRFLAEFLSDARVIDVAPWLRFPLVYGAILPFRPFQSAQAYRKIWGDLGSPLMAHTLTFAERMRRALGSGYVVEIGMRYGSPSIPRALEQLVA